MALFKKYRLSKKKDFETIFKKGKKVYGRYMTLFFLKNNLGLNRFGIIISNKVSKKAVERNKIRRRILEALRKNLDLLKNGFDIVIVAKDSIQDRNYQLIKDEILKLLTKQKALHK